MAKITREKVAQVPWIALVLILALSVFNVLLIKQNLGLRKQLLQRGAGTSINSLKAGDVVAPIAGMDLQGRQYELRFEKGGKRQLLLFFSPSCPYCLQQGPLWCDILNKIDSNRFNVVGIVGDKEDPQAVTRHAKELGYFDTKLVLPIIAINDQALRRYKLTATPATLLIDDNGRVEHAWVGKWDDSKQREVAEALR